MDADIIIAVLAGGLGTRLYPVTKVIPKSLIAVNGVPFIDHQLRLFAKFGIRKAVFCIGHMGDQIRDHLDHHGSHGVEVALSEDGNVLRGTGGAVKQALSLLGDSFLVTYGDSYLDVDYKDVARRFAFLQGPALMTVFRNQGSWDTSNVEFDANRIIAYNKQALTDRMHHIDYGLLAMRAQCFERWGNTERFDLADLLTDLVSRGQLTGYEIQRRFYEVGSSAGIADLEAYLSGTS